MTWQCCTRCPLLYGQRRTQIPNARGPAASALTRVPSSTGPANEHWVKCRGTGHIMMGCCSEGVAIWGGDSRRAPQTEWGGQCTAGDASWQRGDPALDSTPPPLLRHRPAPSPANRLLLRPPKLSCIGFSRTLVNVDAAQERGRVAVNSSP